MKSVGVVMRAGLDTLVSLFRVRSRCRATCLDPNNFSSRSPSRPSSVINYTLDIGTSSCPFAGGTRCFAKDTLRDHPEAPLSFEGRIVFFPSFPFCSTRCYPTEI